MIGHEEPFKILIVDDSSITRMIVQHVLRNSGLTGPHVSITECQNGQEAYETVMHEHVDMIFSDLHMPAMTGIEMLEQIRQDCEAPPPVIFVTSEKRPQFIDQAMSLGAAGVIIKPFTQISFREVLLRVLEKRQVLEPTKSP